MEKNLVRQTSKFRGSYIGNEKRIFYEK